MPTNDATGARSLLRSVTEVFSSVVFGEVLGVVSAITAIVTFLMLDRVPLS